MGWGRSGARGRRRHELNGENERGLCDGWDDICCWTGARLVGITRLWLSAGTRDGLRAILCVLRGGGRGEPGRKRWGEKTEEELHGVPLQCP